jgi:hypothetical protein
MSINVSGKMGYNVLNWIEVILFLVCHVLLCNGDSTAPLAAE